MRARPECWYIYYKVPASALAVAGEAARRIVSGACEGTQVRGSVLRRCEERAAPAGAEAEVTLMEAYEGISDPDAFGTALAVAAASVLGGDAALACRRVERFRALP